jgi:hypothetical protein
VSESHRCYRADRCAGVERVAGQKLGAAIAAENGLCVACCGTVERAIAELPRDYVQLSMMLGKTGPAGGDKVSGSRELPVPIRLSVEAVRADIRHQVSCWGELVCEVLCVDWDSRTAGLARPGAVVQRACNLLTGSMSAFLALRGAVHLSWDQEAEEFVPVEQDGLDGALSLLALHHRARFHTGQTRLVHRLSTPCPRCERLSLERPNGSDTVSCGVCDWRGLWDDYSRLANALANRRVAA